MYATIGMSSSKEGRSPFGAHRDLAEVVRRKPPLRLHGGFREDRDIPIDTKIIKQNNPVCSCM